MIIKINNKTEKDDKIVERNSLKGLVYMLFLGFALLCIVWPILAFMEIIVFKYSKITGLEEVGLLYRVSTVLLYPVFVIVSYKAIKYSKNNKKYAILSALIPLISYLPWFILIITFHYIFELLK